MRVSPIVFSSPPAPVSGKRPSPVPSIERLGGRWSLSVSANEARPRRIATGLFDLLHAGSYLVGSGWTDGAPLGRPRLLEDGPAPSAVLESSVFGAARGEEIVFWITNRAGTALWVLRGRLGASGDVVGGGATYTDADHASEPPYEAGFVLTRR